MAFSVWALVAVRTDLITGGALEMAVEEPTVVNLLIVTPPAFLLVEGLAGFWSIDLNAIFVGLVDCMVLGPLHGPVFSRIFCDLVVYAKF